MKTEQIYTLVNEVNKQTMGMNAISVVDTSSLVAMGNTVLSSSTNTEVWLDTLIQRIGKTIISYRPYTNQLGNLVVSDFAMGAILQKIKVSMPEAVEDVTTQLEDGKSIDMYIISKPKASQKLFVKRTPYTFFVTIQRMWLKEAFTSEAAMGSFISGIYGEVQNKLELSQENLGRLAMANFMATASETPSRVVNLVSNYNALTSQSLTADDALLNEAFLRYAIGQMQLYTMKMKTMSTLYNDGTETRHSPYDRQRFITIADFQVAMATQVQWAAFNQEYVQKSANIIVPYWQSAETPFDIDVTIEETGAEKTLSNIVGFIHDVDALGTYRKEQEVATTPLNARAMYIDQYWHMADLYFNDMSENGIIFTLN